MSPEGQRQKVEREAISAPRRALSLVVPSERTPTMFISMLQENVEVQHFLLGLAKAPVFAFLIAVIGCMEGFKVSGSAESVGEHTTYAYDDDGNRLTEESVDASGTVQKRTTYTYDSNGNMLTKEWSDTYIDWRTTYAYDEDGNMRTSESTTADGILDRTTYTWECD